MNEDWVSTLTASVAEGIAKGTAQSKIDKLVINTIRKEAPTDFFGHGAIPYLLGGCERTKYLAKIINNDARAGNKNVSTMSKKSMIPNNAANCMTYFLCAAELVERKRAEDFSMCENVHMSKLEAQGLLSEEAATLTADMTTNAEWRNTGPDIICVLKHLAFLFTTTGTAEAMPKILALGDKLAANKFRGKLKTV